MANKQAEVIEGLLMMNPTEEISVRVLEKGMGLGDGTAMELFLLQEAAAVAGGIQIIRREVLNVLHPYCSATLRGTQEEIDSVVETMRTEGIRCTFLPHAKVAPSQFVTIATIVQVPEDKFVSFCAKIHAQLGRSTEIERGDPSGSVSIKIHSTHEAQPSFERIVRECLDAA